MKFFKKKAVKWLAGSIITAGLRYFGVPAPVATQVGNVLSGQLESVIEE